MKILLRNFIPFVITSVKFKTEERNKLLKGKLITSKLDVAYVTGYSNELDRPMFARTLIISKKEFSKGLNEQI